MNQQSVPSLPFLQHCMKYILLSGPSVMCHLTVRRLIDLSLLSGVLHAPYLFHCHASCFSVGSFKYRVILNGLDRAGDSTEEPRCRRLLTNFTGHT